MDARMVTGHHGIGRYVTSLIEGLKTRGHEVSILASSDETEKIIGRNSLKHIIWCRLPFAHPAETIELSAKINYSQYDVVHLPSFAVPLKTSPKMVITIHDLIHLHKPSLAHKTYYNTVLRRALVSTGGIIAVSEWAKKDLNKYLSIDMKKISVVRNGLEPLWFEKGKGGKNEDVEKPFYLCLGNTKPHKNIKTLIQAAENLWDQNLKFRLVLSLGGQDLPENWHISSLARKNIKIIKNIPDGELLNYFQNCLAFVSPSFMEGYDYGVAKALVQGKPVILSRGSAHDEFKGSLTHFYGVADNVPDLASSMKTVLDAPPSSQFDHNISTLDEMVEKTLQVYRNCAP